MSERVLLFGSEHADAERIAHRAGEILLEIRSQHATDDQSALGERGDRASHELIMRLLRETYPDDAVLSEEGRDDQARLSQRRVWIIDPLDGTREFGERDRTDWAVHVALAVDGVPIVGAVAMPSMGRTFSTATPPVPAGRIAGPLRIVVSRSRPPALLSRLVARLGAYVVSMGSAGAKTMAVITGEADAYIHADGQYEWDSAAPVAVAAAAGLHISRLDGSALRYNQPDPYLPDQLVCRVECADRLLAAIQPLL